MIQRQLQYIVNVALVLVLFVGTAFAQEAGARTDSEPKMTPEEVAADEKAWIQTQQNLWENSTPSWTLDEIVREFTVACDAFGWDISQELDGFFYVLFTDFRAAQHPTWDMRTLEGYAMGMGNPDEVLVYIDVDYFLGLNEIERKALVFHELFHDIFNVPHSETGLMMSEGEYPQTQDELITQTAEVFDVIWAQFNLYQERLKEQDNGK